MTCHRGWRPGRGWRSRLARARGERLAGGAGGQRRSRCDRVAV